MALMVEKDGGFAGSIRTPASLLTLGIVGVIAASAGAVVATTSRAVAAAIACLAAFTCWSFASILWAGVRSDAWVGSNRTLFYLLVFGLLASWPASVRAVWPILLTAGVAVAIEGVVTVERTIRAADPTQFLIGSRLSEPLGYPNATGALFMTMAWLMIGIASRRWIPAPARGLAFGLAGLFAVLNLLTESRGSVFTVPLVAVVYFVLVSGRLRSLAVLAVVGLSFATEIRPVLHTFTGDPSDLSAHMRHAIDLALVSTPVLAIVGWLFAVLDSRLRIPARITRIIGVVAGVVVLGTVIGVVGVVEPWRHIGNAWHSFKYQGEPSGTTHFGGLGSSRYDVWRVGLIEYEHHPVQGIGQDNFLVPYLRLRKSGEQPIYPHSVLIDLLSQTGLVGTALAAGFLTLTVVAVLRIPSGRERELAGLLVAGASVLVLHGLVDWLWEMPVLGVLGMALFGTACGLSPRRHRAVELRSRGRGALIVAAGSASAVAAGVALALPWVAQREIQAGLAVWPRDHAAAISALQRARTLNPLDNTADLLAGTMAQRLHRYDLMRVHFQSAVDRVPDDWYANLELGIAASLTDRKGLAGSSLRAAVRLNPREGIAKSVLKTFESGRRINSDAIDRALASQVD